MNRHHALYRAFDRNRSLLYVGITLNLPARIMTHCRDAMWWSEVHSISIEHYLTREAAFAAEFTAIVTEFPIYNSTGVSREHPIQASADIIASIYASEPKSLLQLRIPPGLKSRLEVHAGELGLSVNATVIVLLVDALHAAQARERTVTP